MTPSAQEVQTAADGIVQQRRILAVNFGAATERFDTAKDNTAAAVRNRQRIQRLLQAAHSKSRIIGDRIEHDLTIAMLKILDTDKDGELDLKPMRQVEPDRAEYARSTEFIRLATEVFLPEAEELVLACEETELLAEAAQIDALVDQRTFELGLALTPIAAAEGTVTIDTTTGATAELKKRSANTKLRAAGVREKLTKLQQGRKQRENAQKRGPF